MTSDLINFFGMMFFAYLIGLLGLTGFKIPEKKQIRWHVPIADDNFNNFTIVYDYEHNTVNKWQYSQTAATACFGSYLNTSALFVDDPIWGEYFVDEQVGFWDDRTFVDEAPTLLYGGYDGFVRKADQGTRDDTLNYTRTLKTIRINHNVPDRKKRLWKQQWWFDNETIEGKVDISLHKGDRIAKETKSIVISLTASAVDVIKQSITWDKTDVNFQYELTTTSHCALYGFIDYVFPRGRNY